MPPQQPVESAQSYSLLTENLILTQLALHLGFHRYTMLQTHRDMTTINRPQTVSVSHIIQKCGVLYVPRVSIICQH